MRALRKSFSRTCLAFVPRATAAQLAAGLLLSPLSKMALCERESTRLASTFQPGLPPGTVGSPVFNDVDLENVGNNSKLQSAQRNADPKAVFVVTGASRGIGLQFVKTLIDRTKGTIVACCRNPEKASNLHDFVQSVRDPSRIHITQLDLEHQDSIDRAAGQMRDSFDRVDLLLNVAGILGDAITTPGPERALSQIDRSWLELSLAVNLVGPVMWAQALAPLLSHRRSGHPDETTTTQRPQAIIANLSARVGSITDNASMGGWYSYRTSKAALNQATRTMAHELQRRNVWCVSLHPGTTDTDLSKPFQKNVKADKLFPPEFTVESLLNVLDGLEEKHTGGFYDWAGKAISF